MNILHITELYGAGGAFQVAEQLHENLLKEGHNSYVICGYNRQNKPVKDKHSVLFEQNSMLIFHENARRTLEQYNVINVFLLAKLFLFIKKHKIQIIHFHAMQGNFLTIAEIGIVSRMASSVVWTLHDAWTYTGGCMHYWNCLKWQNSECMNCTSELLCTDGTVPYRLFVRKEKQFLNRGIIFVSPSDWIYHEAQRSILRKEKIVTIYNGIDEKQFYPIDKDFLRRKYQLKKTEHYIMFCAADIGSAYKGYRFLLKALKLLHNPEKYTLLIVGNGKLKKFEGFEVKYFGYVSNKKTLNYIYNMADIFVVPSLQDNFPCVTLEAMATETPVVAFPTGGIVNQYTEKEGWFTKNKDAKELASKIEEALSDPQILKEKGKKARERCCKFFAEDRMYRNYKFIYTKCMEGIKKT